MPTIKLQWHKLLDLQGYTHFNLYEEGKRGGDYIAQVERRANHWHYWHPAMEKDTRTGHTGSPVRSRKIINAYILAHWNLFFPDCDGSIGINTVVFDPAKEF